MTTYDTVRVCALAILRGRVLQAGGVSAGRGSVIDWREVRSGETLQTGADAFDTAQLFVTLVGENAALQSHLADVMVAPEPPPPPFVPPPPRITRWGTNSDHRGHDRSFDVGEFSVTVRRHEDDAAQAQFTERLAAAAQEICQ